MLVSRCNLGLPCANHKPTRGGNAYQLNPLIEKAKKKIFIYKYNKVVNKNLFFVVDNNVILPLDWIQIAGKLHIQISKLGGSFLERYGDTNSEDSEDTEPVNTSGTPMIVRVCLKTEPSKNQPH